jgi:hypothetical protein
MIILRMESLPVPWHRHGCYRKHVRRLDLPKRWGPFATNPAGWFFTIHHVASGVTLGSALNVGAEAGD